MHAGGTAHIVPVPGVMGVKDFALTYSNILERYKFERFGRTFFWQRQNYSQAVLCLGINPHFREQNCERHKIYGAWEKRIHINEQTSWLLFFVAFGQHFSIWLEFEDGRKNMTDYCTKGTYGLEDYRRSSDHFGEILATPPKCGGGGRNYDCWLGCAAKFLLSENSDKTPLTELAKNQAFPLFMAACGWRRPGFFTPSVTFENRASRSPDVFLACSQKTPFDVSTSRHIVRPSYGYGALWAHALCSTYLLYTNIFPQYSSNLTRRHAQNHCGGWYDSPPLFERSPRSWAPQVCTGAKQGEDCQWKL